ncbi:hypothetical protein Q6A91_08940 [Aliarcobacter skirrowii]|uniref:hypothetical protein n=1 Tax=Aliarcobacter skirrowii TaxID=28200 RepID=UPI0029AE6A10|nr:hypothetical protein [Aliarcobacter skirrowii]MDX4066142.1 hypothetical protein [Aliarcobacter skirrowii]
MSRTINIKGHLIIQNIQIAREVLNELGLDIKIENKRFIFNEYDKWDQIDENQKRKEIEKIESLYTQKFNKYLEEIAEAERLRIEEEKRTRREEIANQAIENAKKQGYKLKKQIQEDNTIRLVLQKRTY